MPKYDPLRRIDNTPTRYVKAASPDYGESQAGGSNADTLDGYHATTVASPNAIPVTDPAGYISPFINPETALTGNQASGWNGMRYIAPTGRLVDKITATDEYIYVSAPLFAGDESAILSHYSAPNEKIWIMGAGSTDGKQWRYAIERGKGGTTAQAFPAGSEVINLGSAATGGFIYTSSAQNTQSPFIAMRQNNDDATRSSTWKAQFGRLASVPDSFKAQFPSFTDWDTTFSLAAQNAFLDGGIHARYGRISGILTVDGQFYVEDTLSNARMEVGYTVGGWGQVFRDTFGQPVWSVVMPWPDTDGNRPSDIVWTVNSFGERAIYFRREGDDWVLSIGGFDITETSMTNGDFGIYPAEAKLQFAENNYINWSDESIYAWADKVTLGKIDPIGLGGTGGGLSTVYVQSTMVVGNDVYDGGDLVDDGYVNVKGHITARSISVNGATGGNLAMSVAPSFQYTSGTSSANPETDAEDGWLEVVVNGLTRYIPLYA